MPDSGKPSTGRPASAKRIRRLSDLTPDRRNANKHTERGLGLLEHSLRTYGAGRSILVDKHGHVVGGNATLEKAVELGLGVEVVRTKGDKLVVVQREDLDLDDPKTRALALADNRVSEVDLQWAAEALTAMRDDGVDLGAFFLPDELSELLQIVPDFSPVGEDEQGRLDQKKPIVCPSCGVSFVVK
jgi:hypothetical protein